MQCIRCTTKINPKKKYYRAYMVRDDQVSEEIRYGFCSSRCLAEWAVEQYSLDLSTEQQEKLSVPWYRKLLPL